VLLQRTGHPCLKRLSRSLIGACSRLTISSTCAGTSRISLVSSIRPRFGLKIHGHVERPISLTLDDLVREFKRIDVAAVNQCSGNSRGFFSPRVPGGSGPTVAWAMPVDRGAVEGRARPCERQGWGGASALQRLDTGVMRRHPTS